MRNAALTAFTEGLIELRDRAESQQQTMRIQDAKTHAAGEAFAC